MSTYTPIASQTLSSAAASVTFSSIPQGYTDIRVVVATAVNTSTYMRFNSDSGANYSLTEMWGGTQGAISERATNNTRIDLRNSSSTLGNNMITVDIMSYSNSTTFKTLLTAIRDGLYDRVYRQVQLWRNTSAITTITFTPDSGTFPSGSTFSLYGIQVGDKAQKAQGGNIVTTDGTYVYHAFTSTGTFIPNSALTADILVVGGGAGGGSYISGGGGAGQVRAFSSQSLSASTYTCLVAAGGAGGASGAANNGANGNSSQFASLSAAIGGGYGSPQGNGGNGASGGGGTGYPNGTYVGGTGTAGYNGGNGNSDNATYTNCGGGGGAGAAGGNSTVSASGTGGAGVNTVTNWGALSSVFTSTGLGVSGYIGGGGGGGGQSGSAGAAGSGGGGIGVIGNGTPASGVANTGSGGGGSGAVSSAYNGGNGGSGVIILRYAV